ncbi:MAG: hypothetical protein K2Q21_05370 [Chitinophagaceae bacterium]|nr:hypothetical protein [Chitinophagaceae bacterium]
MKTIIIGTVLIFTYYTGLASADTALISSLLKRIEQQQVKEDPFFIKGSFPAYTDKYHIGYSERIKDNNTSFCIVLNTLESVRSKLTASQQIILDSISSRAAGVFKKFENKKGIGTYNFWRQDMEPKFPYNWWVPFFFGNNWHLPDDFDDTVWCLLAQHTDSSNAARIHSLMQHYSNYPAHKIIGCPDEYKSIPAYSTWFGKNFPVFYDLCVAANTLSFVQHFNLNWTKADSATLALLVKAVKSKDYINKYKDLSPYYENKAVIIYHLVKLMSIKPIAELDRYQSEILKAALEIFSKSNNILEQMILCTAMQKSGFSSPAIKLPALDKLISLTEHNDLAFFTGDMLGYFEGNTKKSLAFLFKKALFYNQYCPAYNDALLVEYLVWNKP